MLGAHPVSGDREGAQTATSGSFFLVKLLQGLAHSSNVTFLADAVENVVADVIDSSWP
jgi:hypothetical protein